jgi:hypothetical protein
LIGSSILSIVRALRDRASISPISTPLLNSVGSDFIPSIHSVLILEVVLPVVDPADRANWISLDGPMTNRLASRTILISAVPNPNREYSCVVLFLMLLLVVLIIDIVCCLLLMTGFVDREGRRMDGGVHGVDSAAIAIGRDDRKADALFSPTTNKVMRVKTTTKRSGVGRWVD